jgi:hypothetical protein
LEELTLSNNEIDNSGADDLIRVLGSRKDQFRNIEIDNNKISGNQLTKLFAILPLKNLNLLKNSLTDSQIEPITKTLRENGNIQQIYMSHNNMSKKGLSLLATSLAHNTRLTDFFFTHNDIEEHEDAGYQFLKSFENKRELRSLALNSCKLNNEHLKVLQNAIQDNTKLRELYLFANKIDSDGAICISNMIKNKSFMTTLGLSNNKLGKDGAIELAENGLRGKS